MAGSGAKRTLIVFEARGAWVADRYIGKMLEREDISYLLKGKGLVEGLEAYRRRIFTDSPLWNVIDAARIAAKELREGREVIALGIIDTLIPIAEYNLPGPLWNVFEGALREGHLSYDELVTMWSAVHGLSLTLSRKMADIRRHYKSMGHAIPEEDSLHTALTAHLHQMVTSVEGEWTASLNPSFLPLAAPAFDAEVTTRLFRFILEREGLKGRGIDGNLQIKVFPSRYFTLNPFQPLEPFFKFHDKKKAVDAYKEWLSPFVGEEGLKRLGKSLPFVVPVDSYLHSATILRLERNNIAITPRARGPLKALKGKGGKLSAQAFEAAIHSKLQQGEPILIKYPLVILDYVAAIINALKMEDRVDPAKAFRETWAHNLKRSTDTFKTMRETVDAMLISALGNPSDEVARFFFVEGEPGGINAMTGHVVERLFSFLAERFSAAYFRVASIRREEIEPSLRQLHPTHFHSVLDSMDRKAGSLYLWDGNGWNRHSSKDL